MQKVYAFNKLKTKGHNIIRVVIESQNLVKGRFPGKHNVHFANTEVDGIKYIRKS